MQIKEEFLDDVLETPLVYWDYTPYDTEVLPNCEVQAPDVIVNEPDKKMFEAIESKSIDFDGNNDKTDCQQNGASFEKSNEEPCDVKKLDNLSVSEQSNNADADFGMKESAEEPVKIEKCVPKRKHSQSFTKGGSVKKRKQKRNKVITLTKNGSKPIPTGKVIYFKPIAELKGVTTFPNVQLLFNMFGLNILNHQLSKCMWR